MAAISTKSGLSDDGRLDPLYPLLITGKLEITKREEGANKFIRR
jgi:hypothetical protein